VAPQQKLLLANAQAVGDALMVTCAARDLHRTFPDEYFTAVQTSAPEVWAHNPDIVARKSGFRRVKVGYSSLIRTCSQRAGHFSTGTVQELSERLGRRVVPTDIRPAVYLTDKEKNSIPKGITRPYWLVCTGGKADFEAKIWGHTRYQQVVDSLDLDFVQVGAIHPTHRPLKRTHRNLLGKTSIRELLCLVYHSQGVLCNVTCLMHMAAAFNKPCVVVAGGREPWWWTAYTRQVWKMSLQDISCPPDFVEHHFLDTLGELSCDEQRGCWKSKLKGKHGCLDLITEGGILLPRCLANITVERVVKAVEYARVGTPPKPRAIPTLEPPLVTLPVATRTQQVAEMEAGRAAALKQAAQHRREIRRGRRVRRVRNSRPRPTLSTATPVFHAPALPVYKGSPLVTVCTVAYGDNPFLIKRCLGSLQAYTPKGMAEYRVGVNACSEATQTYLRGQVQAGVELIITQKNIFKYPMMRRLFYDKPITTPWVVWLDDDIQVKGADWFTGAIGSVTDDKLYGRVMCFKISDGHRRFIHTADSYTGKPIIYSKPAWLRFIAGGWFIAPTRVLQKIGWPDKRILNNGDIYMGEACNQQGIELVNYTRGFILDKTPRRGVSHKHPIVGA